MRVRNADMNGEMMFMSYAYDHKLYSFSQHSVSEATTKSFIVSDEN